MLSRQTSPSGLATIAQTWQQQGFCILPGFLEAIAIEQLRTICDRILQQWIEQSAQPDQAANATNMAYLTDPAYFEHHPQELITLLELIADRRILTVLQELYQAPILFHNTQYFFEPRSQSRLGAWHRDTQFLAPDPELERSRILQTHGVHVRFALLDDDRLEYVPASEQRWDTPEEYAIRKAEGGAIAPSGELLYSTAMPNSQRISLTAGDGLLFHAWGIHRGTYETGKPRRTFDIIYHIGEPCNYCPPPPMCFRQPGLLERLSPRARTFFTDFVTAYQDYWQ